METKKKATKKKEEVWTLVITSTYKKKSKVESKELEIQKEAQKWIRKSL